MSERVVETLFIDMKYVFLYHKLGFEETEPDVFRKRYAQCSIVLESERQRYSFGGGWHPLTAHRDFVTLELLDLLLERGYRPSELAVIEDGIFLKSSTGAGRLRVRCEQWGDDYNGAKDELADGDCIYTSRLSGGLIDRLYCFRFRDQIYSRGLFEDTVRPWCFEPGIPRPERRYPEEFSVSDGVLEAYLGDERSVAIPDGVTKIGTGAFWYNTSVEEIALPDSVRVIGGDAFAYCYNLRRINIPASVEDMGDDPFAGCWNLEPTCDSPFFTLDDGTLFTRDMKRLIHYPPWKTRESYEIPDAVEWIGKHSFYGCNSLRVITIGRNVNYIGNNPFSDCDNIRLECRSPKFVYEDGALLNRERTTVFHYSHGWDADEYVVPDTVKMIGRNSFWNCKRIRRIVLGREVRQIGYNPFAKCSNLEIVCECDRYTTMSGVLYDSDVRELICCTAFAARDGISIPDGVENIGRNSFCGCDTLREIVIPDSVEAIGRGAFSNCSSLERVTIPDGVKRIEKWAFSNCDKLRAVEVSEGTYLADGAFLGTDAVVVRR